MAVLKGMFPRIDALFLQFSLGGYYANADDRAGLQAARERHIKQVEQYCSAFRPVIFVPFASFFYFSRESNAYLNEWAVTPAELIEALPQLPAQVLWSGDVLRWEDWEARNALNLARWTDVLRHPSPIRPHPPIAEGEILAAGRALVREAIPRGLALYGPPETHLEIRETGRAAAIDCRNGRFDILERADPRKLALTAPGEELLYFLKSPRGSNIFYGGCLQLASKERWHALRILRNALAQPPPRSRLAALKWYVAKVDRTYFGGIVRRWYSRPRAQAELSS